MSFRPRPVLVGAMEAGTDDQFRYLGLQVTVTVTCCISEDGGLRCRSSSGCGSRWGWRIQEAEDPRAAGD